MQHVIEHTNLEVFLATIHLALAPRGSKVSVTVLSICVCVGGGGRDKTS